MGEAHELLASSQDHVLPLVAVLIPFLLTILIFVFSSSLMYAPHFLALACYSTRLTSVLASAMAEGNSLVDEAPRMIDQVSRYNLEIWQYRVTLRLGQGRLTIEKKKERLWISVKTADWMRLNTCVFSVCGKKTNVSTFHCAKNLPKNFFANGMHWRNWRKFSPGENFHVYDSSYMYMYVTMHLVHPN